MNILVILWANYKLFRIIF